MFLGLPVPDPLVKFTDPDPGDYSMTLSLKNDVCKCIFKK
jgi:hypothetical protein